jgi:hypothetical protein
MRIILTAVICPLLFAVTTTCQEIQWREITIESRHAGMEVSRDLRLVIESHNDVIFSGKHRVNPRLVKKLIDSLTSQALPAPTPSNLGIRAIAAFMPEDSLNRNRLGGGELKEWLSDAVMMRIKEQCDLLGVENRAPESFAQLRSDFEVQHARINPYRSVDYGYVGKEKGPQEQNLLATLRQPSLPPNVAEDVVLLFHDGRIDGVSELAERIGPYVSLALSVPWLNEYRANHPEQKMYIRFVHDRSFSDKAMQNFTADMKQLGKDSLADEVARAQDKVALVFLDYGSDWIVLPDNRMILWRHYLPASFLKWTKAEFTFKRCVEYNANNGGCVGAVVSADGVLQP